MEWFYDEHEWHAASKHFDGRDKYLIRIDEDGWFATDGTRPGMIENCKRVSLAEAKSVCEMRERDKA